MRPLFSARATVPEARGTEAVRSGVRGANTSEREAEQEAGRRENFGWL